MNSAIIVCIKTPLKARTQYNAQYVNDEYCAEKSLSLIKKTIVWPYVTVSKSDNYEVNEANYVLKYKPIRRNVYDLGLCNNV